MSEEIHFSEPQNDTLTKVRCYSNIVSYRGFPHLGITEINILSIWTEYHLKRVIWTRKLSSQNEIIICKWSDR